MRALGIAVHFPSLTDFVLDIKFVSMLLFGNLGLLFTHIPSEISAHLMPRREFLECSEMDARPHNYAPF